MMSVVFCAPGQEQYETHTRKFGRKTVRYVEYDYRDMDEELFSTVQHTLAQCRAERDAWLKSKEVIQ